MGQERGEVDFNIWLQVSKSKFRVCSIRTKEKKNVEK